MGGIKADTRRLDYGSHGDRCFPSGSFSSSRNLTQHLSLCSLHWSFDKLGVPFFEECVIGVI